LREETVETIYLLGDGTALLACLVMWFGRRRPEKPRVSAFTSADIPKILALERGFVLSFSDLQAEIAA
jgi:iron complex transport system substrate-binding protein